MKYLRAVLIVLFIAVPLVAFGAQAGEAKKAKTIDELAKMYDSTSCKECHAEIYAEWQKSLHARSMFGPLNTGRTGATFKTTIENGFKDWPHSGVKKPEDVKIEHLQVCTKCHLPQIEDAEESVAKEIVKNVYAFADSGDEKAAGNLQKLNIGCLICHQKYAIIHKWTYGEPDKKAVYGTKDGDHGDAMYSKMRKSPYMKASILCGQCHGMGPNFDLKNPTQCATLYGSHLFAYVPEAGEPKTCQDCHMKGSKLGHNMQSYRSPEMAKLAVDFHVEAYAHQWRDIVTTTPQAQVTVELKNNAGHAIPDG